MANPTLLIVDDDSEFRSALARLLRSAYCIRTAGSLSEAFAQLSPPPDALILDIRLDESDADNRDGLLLLERLHQDWPEIPVLMVTAHGDIDLAVECMRLGAVDFLQKRSDVRETKARLQQALERGKLTQRIQQLERDLSLVEPRAIIGQNIRVQEIKRVTRALGQDGSVTVLIRGETGTGKELVARAIHAGGRRQSGPFVPVMLNSLPSSMVETELFGYEAGAFTDARERRIGYLERAHGGILFLDEVGELEMNVQVKLLRLLEEREIQRLGSTRSIQLDIQVIAATNADLRTRIQDGSFREDLFYRLQGHELVLPPVRDRSEDIPALIEHFLNLFRQQGKRIHRIAPDAVRRLQSLPWPGNVRQLKNSIESAIFNAELNGHIRIELVDLPADLRGASSQRVTTSVVGTGLGEDGFSMQEALARMELRYVEQALHLTGGKKTEAWKLLGYNDRETLYRHVRRIFTRHPTLRLEYPGLVAKDDA